MRGKGKEPGRARGERERRRGGSSAHLREAVPEVVGVGVGAAELFQVLDEALPELLLTCHRGFQHEQDGRTLEGAEEPSDILWIRTKADSGASF